MPPSNSSAPTDGGGGSPPGDPRAVEHDAGAARPLGLFGAYGIELEYMLVSADTLDPAAAADELLEAAAGEHTDEFENGPIAWNNELALHVIEFKCNGPRPSLAGLAEDLAANVKLANSKLDREGRRLMPTAMHPWMDPADVKLWPHGTREIYDAFDRIFGCKGHGWANLQSMQLNLPFANDEEFGRLHAAIRFLLPILPGLAASSPIVDGLPNGILDNRLVVYRGNCAKIPSITGAVVPEAIGSIGEYHERLLAQVYRDLEPHDPERVLRHEWVNARGAIARFDRMAIEIRVLDVQETPYMDVAYAALVVEVLKLLVEERWADRKALDRWHENELGRLLELAERRGEDAGVSDRRYLSALGFRGSSTSLMGLWEHLIEQVSARGTLNVAAGRKLEHYLRHGSLATRIAKAVGLLPTRKKIERVYAELCDALASGEPFAPRTSPPAPLAR
jgi:gamma-glutamyl:cysteine ligase YbdK (ATP-grasp superfamily)